MVDFSSDQRRKQHFRHFAFCGAQSASCSSASNVASEMLFSNNDEFSFFNNNWITPVSETSETSEMLQILRPAPLEGIGVGNVGFPFRESDVPTPPLRPNIAETQQ